MDDCRRSHAVAETSGRGSKRHRLITINDWEPAGATTSAGWHRRLNLLVHNQRQVISGTSESGLLVPLFCLLGPPVALPAHGPTRWVSVD
jgi:hypothetical protein